MVIPMVALAKLSLIGTAHGGQLATALLWPFVLKFSFSIRPLRDACTDMVDALRLFIFQIAHIAFDGEPNINGGLRWRRVVRLVYERSVVLPPRRGIGARSTGTGEDSLIALSMLAL